jgi:hypothetical protein
MGIDWKRKLTSRKFWAAIALFVSGCMVAFGGSAEKAEVISGLIMQGAAVVAYIIGEGLADAAAANGTVNVQLNGSEKE